MDQGVCPQCGATSRFNRLCPWCETRFDLQAKANIAQMAEAQERERISEIEEEEEIEEARRKWARIINDYPNEVEERLAEARDNDQLLALIARLAEECKHLDEDRWLQLKDLTPFEASVTYGRMRKLLSGRISEWWKKQDQFSPSPVTMLKVLAKALVYTDIESITVVREELPRAISSIESDISAKQAEKIRLTKEVDQKTRAKAKAAEAVRRADEAFQKAEQEKQAPIDPITIATKTESEWRGFEVGIVIIVFGLLFLILGRFGLLLTVPLVLMGGHRLYVASRLRWFLSPDESKEFLERKSREYVKSLIDNRNTAATNAQEQLGKARQTLATAEAECQRAEQEIELTEQKLAEFRGRLTKTKEEMLHGKIDPVLQSIIDA